MTVKTFREPPGADPHAVVVWGGLKKSQPLPDLDALTNWLLLLTILKLISFEMSKKEVNLNGVCIYDRIRISTKERSK